MSPVARCARRGIAFRPAKHLSADTVCFRNVPHREGDAFRRIFVRFVARTEFNWVNAHLVRELVYRRFEREGADGFTGCAHESVGHDVQVDDLLPEPHGFCLVEMSRRERKLLGKVIVPGSLC